MNPTIHLRLLKDFAITVTILFFLLGTSRTSPAQEEKDKGPKISIDTPAFNLGEIDEGTPITHTYIIKNTGNEDLKIEKVHPT